MGSQRRAGRDRGSGWASPRGEALLELRALRRHAAWRGAPCGTTLDALGSNRSIFREGKKNWSVASLELLEAFPPFGGTRGVACGSSRSLQHIRLQPGAAACITVCPALAGRLACMRARCGPRRWSLEGERDGPLDGVGTARAAGHGLEPRRQVSCHDGRTVQRKWRQAISSFSLRLRSLFVATVRILHKPRRKKNEVEGGGKK